MLEAGRSWRTPRPARTPTRSPLPRRAVMNPKRSFPTPPAWPIALGLAGVLLLLTPAAASAAGPDTPLVAAAPLLADSFSWDGFVKYWSNYANRGDRVIQVVFLVLALALFIITRGKWRK